MLSDIEKYVELAKEQLEQDRIFNDTTSLDLF